MTNNKIWIVSDYVKWEGKYFVAAFDRKAAAEEYCLERDNRDKADGWLVVQEREVYTEA